MTGPAHREGVLDTSVVLLLSAIEDPEALPEFPQASAVTLAELSVGPLVARSDAERAARQAVLQQFEADFDPLPFDDSAARAFGRVAASLRAAGRKVHTRGYDGMIAAIALAHGLPLYTANPDDFGGIDGLEVRVVEVGADG
jgi:tRNA(fMet)-specific endonuclease VapC